MVNYSYATSYPSQHGTNEKYSVLPVSVELYQSITDVSEQNKHIGAGEWHREAKSANLQIQSLLETKVINK